MKKRNGKYYAKEKTSLGHTFWVEMSHEEVVEHDLYWGAVILMPILCLLAFAVAAGIIG